MPCFPPLFKPKPTPDYSAHPQGRPVLQIQDLCKSFPGKTVAGRISFAVPCGGLTAVLGKSGSGKSTLLHMIAGLAEPDGGTVILNGRTLNGLPPQERRVAMMFQDLALLPHLNVWQNAALGLTLRGTDKPTAKARALAVLADLDLAEAAERKTDTLSGGEKQRTALARALTAAPELLLLDEPFSSLDTGLRGQLQDLVVQSVRARQIPALMVTHDPAEACLMADQILLLIDGAIRQSGRPADILKAPVDAAAARLMGCLNVSDTHYVPPEAIRLNQSEGVNAAVLSVFRLPQHNRVRIAHPQYGGLDCFADHDTAAGLAGQTRVWIDEGQVVRFG